MSELNRVKLLDTVALLTGVPEQGLATGQVGTVVELLNEDAALVEFSDDEGQGYAIVAVSRSALLALKYVPQAA